MTKKEYNAYQLAWYHKNKEKCKLRMKKYYEKNVAQFVERAKKWKEKNYDKYLASTRKYHQTHQDHKRPISKGGTHHMNNLQVAHRVCNGRKSNKWRFI